MSEIKEQFVTYEIALKLKELGFDEKCLGMYGSEFEFVVDESSWRYAQISKDVLQAPLWQQVIDWLEKKGYYINITRVFQWQPLPIKFLGWCIHIGTDNPEEELECNSYYISNFYPTKKQAINEAILKAIELCQNKK